MAVIKTGEHISRIAGTQGDHVYSSWKGRAVLRSKSKNRSNPSSPRQATARAGTTALAKDWSEKLDLNGQDLWEFLSHYGETTPAPASTSEQGSRVVIPQPKPTLSGYDAFVRHNQRAIMTGIRDIGDPILVPSRIFPNPVTSLEKVVTPPIPVNFALSFDGVDEDVTMGDVLDYEYNQVQSWEFWFRMPSPPVAPRYFGKMLIPPYTGYGVLWSGNNIVFQIRRGIGLEMISVTRAFVPDGSWHQLIVTYEGNNNANGMHIYLDGVVGQVIQNNVPLTVTMLSDAPLTFASWNQDPGSWFAGDFDCIRNYQVELAQPEVDVLWNGGLGLFSADPLGGGSCQGAWMFCTGGGNTLFDISGNNYHGTLRNMEPGDWIIGHVPCPDIPGYDRIEWDEPTVPVGSKVRIWLLSYDAHVHRQHVDTVDVGIGFWVPDTVRVAQGAEVPIASMPGHYLVQADIPITNENGLSQVSSKVL